MAVYDSLHRYSFLLMCSMSESIQKVFLKKRLAQEMTIMSNRKISSANNYQRHFSSDASRSKYSQAETNYCRFAAAEMARRKRESQSREKREDALVWMLMYSSIERYAEQRKELGYNWCPPHAENYIELTCGRAVLSNYTKNIDLIDLDILKIKYPIRFAMAELVVKLDLYEHVNFIGGLVARFEKYPSWRDVLEDEYSSFKKKKSNGWRVIHKPSENLKNLQRAIHLRLSRVVYPHSSCHGFVAKRSNLTNAHDHIGKKLILRVDIKNAFDTSSQVMVNRAIKNVFHFFSLSSKAVDLLGHIVTFKNSLPTGAPTSPVLLNAILHNFDKEVSRICSERSLKYTRYADDIVVSGEMLGGMQEVVEEGLRELGFELNNRKTKLMPYWRKQKVTGVVVNVRLNLERDARRKLRAAVHSWIKTGTAYLNGAQVNAQMLRGHISYAIGVNKSWGQKLLWQLSSGTED